MEALKIIAAVFAVIFLGYIVVRLWSYGIFRSYFDAKKPKKEE